jgi:phage FluMu protein gp41
MAGKKAAAKRYKDTGSVKGDPLSQYDESMKNLTPEQVMDMAKQVSEKVGRPIEEVAEAMKSEASFVVYMNEYMPMRGAMEVGDIVRPVEARQRRAYHNGTVVCEWGADDPQEAEIVQIYLRRNAQPVMIRVRPLHMEECDFLFMSKFDLEKVEDVTESTE